MQQRGSRSEADHRRARANQSRRGTKLVAFLSFSPSSTFILLAISSPLLPPVVAVSCAIVTQQPLDIQQAFHRVFCGLQKLCLRMIDPGACTTPLVNRAAYLPRVRAGPILSDYLADQIYSCSSCRSRGPLFVAASPAALESLLQLRPEARSSSRPLLPFLG